MTKYDLNVRDYWRIIRKRKFIIILTFLAMLLFSFISAIITSPTPLYRANATIKFEKLAASITGLYDPMLTSTGSLETEAAVIKSYYIQELVAKKLGMIPREASPETVRNNAQFIRIILDLKDKIQTEQDGASNLINIYATSTDPKLAQTLANTVAQVYRDEHVVLLNKRASDGRKFIEAQLAVSKDKLVKAEDSVRDFREKNKIISAEGEASGLTAQMASLQAAYDRESTSLEQVAQMSRFVKGAENRNLTSDKAFTFNGATAAYNSLNEKLVQLMLQRDMLLLGYTENFPQVVELKKQIQEVVKAMNTQLTAQQRILSGNVDMLKKQMRDYEEKFLKLPEKGLELSRLERNVGVEKEVYTLLEKKYQEALIQEAVKIEEVQIVKPALEPSVSINRPKIGLKTLLGMIIGLILGVVFAFLIETFDTSIAAIEEIEDFLRSRVLGIIPYLKIEDLKEALKNQSGEDIDDATLRRRFRLIAHFMPTSTPAENYRALRTNFNFLTTEKGIKSVVFTSTYPEEGKTSVICNLAVTIAQTGRKILLIDGDFRRPVLSRVFGIDLSPGFTDVILGKCENMEAIRSVSEFMTDKLNTGDNAETSSLDNLHLMTSGTIVTNPSELIESKAVAEMIKTFSAEYDVVLIDAPPVLAATDATIWGSIADGVVLVYQVGRVARGSLKRAKAQLDNVRANILGIVMNGLKADISPDFSYQDKYYYYSGGYGNRHKKAPETAQEKLSSLFRGGSLAGSIKAVEEKFAKVKASNRLYDKVSSDSAGNDHSKPTLKSILLVAALVFLGLGVLSQTGSLKWSMFSKQKSVARERQVIESRAVSIAPAKTEAPLGEATPSTQNTAGDRPVAAQSIPDMKQGAPPPEKSVGPIPAAVLPPVAPPSDRILAGTAAKLDSSPDRASLKKYHYAIQIAASFESDKAGRIVSDLKEDGVSAFVKKIPIPGKSAIHKIYIGPFADKNAAEVFLKANKEIGSEYPDSIFVKQETL
jgi:succinoglycan biosynthesis transport protein ExoP